ncbi:MAG: flagellar basal body-associated FliL family protein [Rhodobacteraceae bacterium]|nr:flagellar basal body-associated FliL family protein [Paracoccaceae bacterium]
MAEAIKDTGSEDVKSSKTPLFLGLVLALAGAGGGYLAVSSGLIPFGSTADQAAADGIASSNNTAPEPIGDVVFVPMPQIVVSLGPNARATHLRFTAQLEVPEPHASEVTKIIPRIVDVLNDYLRALDSSDVEAQGALFGLRSQMLRRIQIVTGESRVKDLLVMEFVLN